MPKYANTPEQCAAMVAAYNGGLTIRQCAAKYHYSYGGMHDLLRRNGAIFRAKGYLPRRPAEETKSI